MYNCRLLNRVQIIGKRPIIMIIASKIKQSVIKRSHLSLESSGGFGRFLEMLGSRMEAASKF